MGIKKNFLQMQIELLIVNRNDLVLSGEEMKNFVKLHSPTLFMALLIFTLSSIPSLKPPNLGVSFEDKIAHFLEFGTFGFFLQRSFNYLIVNKPEAYYLAFLVGSAYGALDEIHQLFVSGRQASIEDFIADTIGIVVSQILFWIGKKIDLF